MATGWWVEKITQPTAGASMAVSGSTPTVGITQHRFIQGAAAGLTVTGSVPVLRMSLFPGNTTRTITGGVPFVHVGTRVQPSGASLSATGGVPVLGTGLRPTGASLTATGSTAGVVIDTPLVFIGANTSGSTTVTIPAHQIGDLILIYAFLEDVSATPAAPVKPGAGGTVPAWVDITANTGANFCSSRLVRFTATATNHTSGTWSGGGSYAMCAAVIRNPNASPVGGNAESGSTAANGAVSPSVTLSNTDGSSMLLHFGGRRGGAGFSAWSAAPAGYTSRAAAVPGHGIHLMTKNDTTSDGSINRASDGFSTGYRGATVEILAI